jgi:hypothetical protein
MRAVSLAFVLSLPLGLGCVDRTVDIEVDYTEEVERICEALCEKASTCGDPPFTEYDECMASCTVPGGLHEDSTCGQAFRDWFECLGSTANCEEYLDARNTHAEDYTCKEETEYATGLLCGLPGENH